MLGKPGQDLPIFCQANTRPLCAENPVAPSLCPWGSGSVVYVVREGGAGEWGKKNIQGPCGHGHWLYQGFPLPENISGIMFCLTIPLTPGWKVLEPHNLLSWVFFKNSKPRIFSLSLSLSLSLWRGFSVFFSSQLLHDLDMKLSLTRVLKADHGLGIYHPTDHRRCQPRYRKAHHLCNKRAIPTSVSASEVFSTMT